jgi:hypothetical protein
MKNYFYQLLIHMPGLLVVLITLCSASRPLLGFETYSGCASCHGDFRGTNSTKGTVFLTNNHDMHRNSGSMGSACNLCHSGSSRTPVYIGKSNGTTSNSGIGCSGCHVGPGLRKHHAVNGVAECADCHDADPQPPAETQKPPYYGTADTKVKNPENLVRASNTNENWSVNDYLGLDNDGNNLYDAADYAVGPFRILSAVREGDDVKVSWVTAGGRTNFVQAAGSASGLYTNLTAAVEIPGVGMVTNTTVHPGGAKQPMLFYRLGGALP